MIQVVAAVIEREDRRMLVGQRRKNDTSALKWEFPGGKVEPGETPEQALARELREELGATMLMCVQIARVQHRYADGNKVLDILFYAASIAEAEILPLTFEATAWVLPRDLGQYDFLPANAQLIAHLATGRIKPGEILAQAAEG